MGPGGFSSVSSIINFICASELRFANDILLFANSGPEAAQFLEKLIAAVGRAGLFVNADKR